jgi:hypothetical protein
MVAALGFEALTASQQIPAEQHGRHSEAAQQDAKLPSPTINQPRSSEERTKRKEKQDQAAGQLKEFTIEFFNLKLSDAIIAIFTVVLASKTSGLFSETGRLREATDRLYAAGERQLALMEKTSVAQSRDMKDSIGASIVAANAALQSAHVADQTLLASGRPMVLLELVNTDNIVFPVGTRPSMVIKFVNHGSAPAILKVRFIELLDDPPAPPKIDVAQLKRTYEIVGAGGEINPIIVPVKTDNPAQIWLDDRAKRLVLHGYLEYVDTLDAIHTHRIYLRLGNGAQTLTEEGGPEYNVRKTERFEAVAKDG